MGREQSGDAAAVAGNRGGVDEPVRVGDNHGSIRMWRCG